MRIHRLVLAFLLCAAPAVWAQGRLSAVTGTVVDESGGAVIGATIQARHLASGETRGAISGQNGGYRIPLLELGAYTVTASKVGFNSSEHQGVTLELDREAVVDHVLHVGDVAVSVVVTGQARNIEAAPSALSNLVDASTIERMPLNGRDYIQLATLQAGVPVARAHGRDVNFGYGLQISISGSRPFQNNFRLDGVSLTSYSGSTPGSINGVNLGVDAVEEFSVLSSTYSAEYGRAAGGIVNAVTRSGSNAPHGTLFYFHRNDNLDARNFFDPGEPPEFRRHQYGGSVGGPIVRNRAFFFANYEALREARGNTTVNTTLSAEARKGNLTSGTVKVDPEIAKAVALYPLPNGTILGDTGLFYFSNDEQGRQDFVTTRIDETLGDADRLFLRYSFDDGARSDETDFAIAARTRSTRDQSAAFEQTHIFSANVLNTARFGFLRTRTLAGDTKSQVPGTDDPDLAFLPGGGVIGVIQVSGMSAFGGGSGSQDRDSYAFNSFQISDDVTWLRGRHSLKLGARFERTQLSSDSQSRVSGEFRFSSVSAFLRNVPYIFRAQVPGSDTVRGLRQWIGALYFQDTWMLARRVTFDLGLRWEWATVPTEVNGKLSNLDRLTDTEMRLGDPLFDNPSLGNPVPRAGLAWDVLGSGRTMLRGGYGIYLDLLLSQFFHYMCMRNPPFFRTADATNVVPGDFPKGGYLALTQSKIPFGNIERMPRNVTQPYVQQWNLSIEQTLDQNTTARIGYVGSHGLNLSSVTADSNLVEPITLPDGRLFYQPGAPVINPALARIRDHNFDAHSFYHALQVRIRRRLNRGLQTQVSYSFSKSIDDSSNFFYNTEAANAFLLPITGSSRFNRGLSGQDVRHYVVISGTWDLPVTQGPGWRRFFGGWQTGGIVTYASGLPTTPLLSYDATGTKAHQVGIGFNQRPGLAPGASNNPVTGDIHGWIDRSAFLRPERGFLGNLGRNTIIGPDMANVDFSLVKRIQCPRLGEGASLDFRAEFFNLFNRANFDLPAQARLEIFNPTSTPEDFGRITSAGKSREIQFGLKLRF
jgi:hypothetical protein